MFDRINTQNQPMSHNLFCVYTVHTVINKNVLVIMYPVCVCGPAGFTVMHLVALVCICVYVCKHMAKNLAVWGLAYITACKSPVIEVMYCLV